MTRRFRISGWFVIGFTAALGLQAGGAMAGDSEAPTRNQVDAETGATSSLARIRALLVYQRSTLDRRIAEVDAQISQKASAQPESKFREIRERELVALSDALTRAQIAAINARANYSSTHPILARAEAAESALYDRYEQVASKVMELDEGRSELSKLKTDEAELRRLRARVEERIQDVDLLQKLINHVDGQPPRKATTVPEE